MRSALSRFARLAFVVGVLGLGGGFGHGLRAQAGGPLILEVREETGDLSIVLGDLLADPSLQEAVESGLPLRIEVTVQLWRDGFFDSQVGQARWRASVLQDPLEGEYVLELGAEEGDGGGPDEIRGFPDLDELRAALPRTIEPDVRPAEEGRYYYLARLAVETLSLSDLEELRRWLRGDLAPAISGDGDIGSAAQRGLRRTVIRVLGMPTRRYDARTPTFRFSPPEADGPG